MKLHNDILTLSASDLSAHLGCQHLTQQSVLVATTDLKRPFYDDPTLALLRAKGIEHEQAYLAHLAQPGTWLRLFPDHGATAHDTLAAMRAGHDVIFQANLDQGCWRGRADFLLKVEGDSELGDYHYEVADTKLARETRAGTVLQLCLYAELVGQLQGRRPDRVMVVSPGKSFEPEVFRVDHFYAYYQMVKQRLQESVSWADPQATTVLPRPQTYPEPCAQCDVCNWSQVCRDKRREDDHLSLVAGISRMQRSELRDWGIETLTQLGETPLYDTRRPKRGTKAGLTKVQDQARVQLEGTRGRHPYHEIVEPVAEGEGLARLPEPSDGDVFFDLEGDAFAGNASVTKQHGEEGAGGLEYMFGWTTVDGGEPQYHVLWAFDGADEKRIFEQFMDEMVNRRQRWPEMHIYHYAPYEPGALKRLMGRYATREQEVDDLLRHGVFVDLYGVVRQGVRCSVESYSIKRLEEFYGYTRAQELPELGRQKKHFEAMLQNGEGADAPQEMREIVQLYNEDDCVSTLRLRDWLEALRSQLEAQGTQVPRPAPPVVDPPTEERSERDARVARARDALLEGVPVVRDERDAQAKWLLAHMLDWHKREDKVTYWEKFRLMDLVDDEFLDDRAAIGGLVFDQHLPKATPRERTKRVRYRFPTQEVRMGEGDDLFDGVLRDDKGFARRFGTVVALDLEQRTVDVKKRKDMADHDATSVFTWKLIEQKEQPRSLVELAEWVIEHGVDGVTVENDRRAGRDLLLRRPPRLKPGESLQRAKGEDDLPRACRLGLALDGGCLPIQGPPGSGKTFTGAHMIAALVQAGRRVGVTAVSHKVIDNLLEKVVEVGSDQGQTIQCVHKGGDGEAAEDEAGSDDTDGGDGGETGRPGIRAVETNDEALAALQDGSAQVVGGTSWMWAREDFENSVDVLFVDEAGQMSLANVLAVSPCARNLVLLGDPQQLEQPQKGSHPEGTEVSALEHVLTDDDGNRAETMPAERGLFLEKTWRLHPRICQYTSKLFYEGKLHPKDGLERQALTGPTRFAGAGLFVEPVEHEGNQSASSQEVARVRQIVDELRAEGVTWTDRKGEEHPVGWDDILVVAPYNAQVVDLQTELGAEARVGTVDKFQGQEAPVVIYSMTASSADEAPRGMEFLFSGNRLNVATSRARCCCVVVASPALFAVGCGSVRQMRVANGVCAVGTQRRYESYQR